MGTLKMPMRGLMLKTETPKTIHLSDYRPHPFSIEKVHLTFHLDTNKTKVISKLTIKRNPEGDASISDLVLNGEELTFLSATINDKLLTSEDYSVAEESLTLKNVPDTFTLTIENEINPEANKALDGLYKSGPIFCTQNEPEGFRRITYYLDRPDVMAKFTTKIIADETQYPVLLSNGNPIGEGKLDGGLHWVEWEDPFVKPCYLYALVAGDLGLVQDSYTTMSGRKIDLRIYCDKGNESRCDHAMESLKKSMKWDEETFGLEYDLDIYMIVAVDSFNMGAMENKGLNIFNSVYVLANEETATDQNFLGIESVVGHEYFHNWTGNRITCRDWFQLTLKEGLTVYRDQEFSSDLNSRTVQRIQDVERLRTMQFVEDAGPTAHPIKPSSYIEINNFYTATIYEKGAEVIRMVRTMLGVDGFRKGMDKYFELFDGQAVTTEDFLHAMSVANDNFDFEQFKNWYTQAGTPEVNISTEYDETQKTYTLKIKQSCAPSPGQNEKKPYHFPVSIGLLNSKGEDMHAEVLHVRKESEEFTFKNIEEKPVLSFNRGFTAPVRVNADFSLSELFFLMANDSDLFNRYEASQLAGEKMIARLREQKEKGEDFSLDAGYLDAFGSLIKERTLDPAVKEMLLGVPGLALLAQSFKPIDYLALNEMRGFILKTVATTFKSDLMAIYKENATTGAYSLDPLSIGKRALRTKTLRILASLKDDSDVEELAKNHFEQATNMTEKSAGLAVLSSLGGEAFKKASDSFYAKWKDDTLVIQKWLVINSSASTDETFDLVQELEKSDVYDANVPNLVRSLWGGFSGNFVQFHHATGRGYKLMADKVLEMDGINPQVASRLASAFKDYKKLVSSQQELMKPQLERILAKDDLSKNVFEIVSKIKG